jgi:succinate dehydrogenase / fumarate reductase, cytochrome b subunit
MSAIAISQLNRPVRFYEAAAGKKVVMALTGVILFGYVLAHMLGNLQIFEGPDAINSYAHFLHSHEGALWVARSILLLSVVLHIVASVQLWVLNNKARPVSYVRKADVPTSYAARTMKWSGPIIAAFVIFHVLHLTTGNILPLQAAPADSPDAYDNVIMGFQHPLIAIFYIVAVLLLCMHLYHGLWSMFQSLGISHPRYTPGLKRFAGIFAIVVAAGYISIPVASMAHLITPEAGTAHTGKVESAHAARR